MIRGSYRKTAPKVHAGQVLRKNRTALSPRFEFNTPGSPVIERRRPGEGYRHLIKKRDVERFITLIPDWQEKSKGLRAIVLDEGSDAWMGWHRPGIVAVSAWCRDVAHSCCHWWVLEHRVALDRLGVKYERIAEDLDFVHWDETSARGFQLMHILLHELGHHHDRMTTRTRARSARGEDFAEDYANDLAEQFWEDYFRVFGW